MKTTTRFPFFKIFFSLNTIIAFSSQSYAGVDKYCGTLRPDLKYTFDSTSTDTNKSQVELCVDVDSGGVHCGVSSDPLLISSLNLITGLKGNPICMKLDSAQSPANIISVEGTSSQ